MKLITVQFTVDDEFDLDKKRGELRWELKRVTDMSEIGLNLLRYQIDETGHTRQQLTDDPFL